MQRNGASRCEYYRQSVETKATTWLEFPIGGTAIVEQILVSEEKSMTVGITVWDSSRKVNLLSKFTRSISPTRIGKPVLRMDVKVSKDKHICRWADWEKLIYVRWNRIKNRTQRQRRWLIEKKEVSHWVK